MTVEEMIQAEVELEANTIECCVHPGCGTHYLNTMAECGDCGDFMCPQHVCSCPIEGVEAA